MLRTKHGIAAEWLDLQSKLGQQLVLLEQQGRFGRGQVHRLGNQEPLRLDLSACHPAAQLLVQDPLVKCVLVDHDHPIAGRGDQIAVVDLDRLEHGFGHLRRRWRPGLWLCDDRGSRFDRRFGFERSGRRLLADVAFRSCDIHGHGWVWRQGRRARASRERRTHRTIRLARRQTPGGATGPKAAARVDRSSRGFVACFHWARTSPRPFAGRSGRRPGRTAPGSGQGRHRCWAPCSAAPAIPRGSVPPRRSRPAHDRLSSRLQPCVQVAFQERLPQGGE